MKKYEKLTIESFVTRSKKIHGDKYDYSLIKEINSLNKIKIMCLTHGIFEQMPYSHLNKRGCPKCANSIIANKLSHNKNIFIEKAKNIHGEKYDYTLTEYINNHTKVKIICNKHGAFEQQPNNHLSGQECPKCGQINRNINSSYDNNIFIKKAKNIHGEKYDYSSTEYVNSYTKVKITCPIHGDFNQYPRHHYRGVGCPKCKQSKGELKIQKFLEENNIEYKSQHTFNDCIHIQLLRFDFYLPKYNICIEYDGQQHFNPLWYDKNGVEFEKTQKRDKIKNEYCYNNGINLIRIKFNNKKELKEIINPILYNCYA
jgi:Zn finger protein HypA/HybF involved in hydrogenase expression